VNIPKTSSGPILVPASLPPPPRPVRRIGE